MKKLISCPHCGSSSVERIKDLTCVVDSQSVASFIECVQCGARGPISENEELAVQRWNNRHESVSNLRDLRDRYRQRIHELMSREDQLVEALSLYANPSFYRGCTVHIDNHDRCGGFERDFGQVDGFKSLRPGQFARNALKTAGKKAPTSVDELITYYHDDYNTRYDDIERVARIALELSSNLPDSQGRCMLYLLAKHTLENYSA